jgi:hypothetical protein
MPQKQAPRRRRGLGLRSVRRPEQSKRAPLQRLKSLLTLHAASSWCSTSLTVCSSSSSPPAAPPELIGATPLLNAAILPATPAGPRRAGDGVAEPAALVEPPLGSGLWLGRGSGLPTGAGGGGCCCCCCGGGCGDGCGSGCCCSGCGWLACCCSGCCCCSCCGWGAGERVGERGLGGARGGAPAARLAGFCSACCWTRETGRGRRRRASPAR